MYDVSPAPCCPTRRVMLTPLVRHFSGEYGTHAKLLDSDQAFKERLTKVVTTHASKSYPGTLSRAALATEPDQH